MVAQRLKLGVIGAGVFGNYHAAKANDNPRIEFVGVFDPQDERAQAAAKRHNTKPYFNCNHLIQDCQALIVASPAVHHGPLAIAVLKAGRHVFVEKPIAVKVSDAQTMIEMARAQNLVLQVDHQERYVAKAIGLDVVDERPLRIVANRFGPHSTRGLDVSVTLDLMTHDIDLVCWLMNEYPERIQGDTQQIYSEFADASRARLEYSGGRVAQLEASRAEEGRERTMRIEYESGALEIDFVAKTFNNTTPYDFDENFLQNPMAADSLGTAVNAFVGAILEGDPVFIDGADGLRSLEIALAVDGSKG